jgi:hypothetical protein
MARLLFTSKGSSLHLAENQRFLSDLLSLNSVYFPQQVHGTNVVVISESEQEVAQADAVVTTLRGVGVGVIVADCLPLLISGPDIVGAVHAGRRGLLAGVIERTLEVMAEESAYPISTFSAAIGPSICGGCYEVSQEMHDELVVNFPALSQGVEGRRLNLQSEAFRRLREGGITSLHDVEICTRESEEFYSYRSGDLKERQAGVISL